MLVFGHRFAPLCLYSFIFTTAMLPLKTPAVTPANEPLILQRQNALEQQLRPTVPDVRLTPPASGFSRLVFPQEKPCFPLNRVVLTGTGALPHWLPLQRIAGQAVGHCLGGKGINLLMSALQNRLIDHGYITTRVLAPSQDLKSGELKLSILAGKIRQVMRWVTGLMTKIHCLVRSSMVLDLVSAMALVKGSHGELMPGQTGGKVAGIRNSIQRFKNILILKEDLGFQKK